MIRWLVDHALNNRFLVLSMAALLFFWGMIAFKKLPVEAYPDVANTWVQVFLLPTPYAWFAHSAISFHNPNSTTWGKHWEVPWQTFGARMPVTRRPARSLVSEGF